MGLRVGVYAICKNEAAFAARWMASMREADTVCVTDTGSTDGTAELLRRAGAQVFEETVSPWRFDAARNRSLAYLPADVDICVCTDLDEVFTAGWRARLEAAWIPGTTRARYLYNWSHKADGSPAVQFVYGKIHARRGYRWFCPVHEYLTCDGAAERAVFVPGLVLEHYPDPAKPRTSYLPLLERAVRDEPQNERMRYYLGREYLYARRWDACIASLRGFLAMPTATWAPERAAAMRWMALASYRKGEKKEVRRWYLRAVGETPGMRDAYVEYAQMAYAEQDWETVFAMTEAALAIHARSEEYVNMGYAWDETPDDLCAIACWHLGLRGRALAHARRALAFSPRDERLLKNVAFMENHL